MENMHTDVRVERSSWKTFERKKKKKTFLAIYQVTGPEFQFTVVYCYSSLQLFNVLKRIMNRGR